MSLQFHCNI